MYQSSLPKLPHTGSLTVGVLVYATITNLYVTPHFTSFTKQLLLPSKRLIFYSYSVRVLALRDWRARLML